MSAVSRTVLPSIESSLMVDLAAFCFSTRKKEEGDSFVSKYFALDRIFAPSNFFYNKSEMSSLTILICSLVEAGSRNDFNVNL